jgi:hypothetical protein
MEITRNSRAYYGTDDSFTMTLDSKDVSKGLRPSSRSPRNSEFDVVCSGAVGRDGVLSRLESLTRIDTSVITDSFPYPQIFVFPELIIVFGSTKIYEYNPTTSTLTLKLTVTVGNLWRCIAKGFYAYMSNGVVAVERSPESGVYSLATDVPIVESICDFNSQIIVGAPTIATVLSEI